MLNTYRVISMSLVMSLFFAAPLLCVQPISYRLKKAEHRQDKKVRVVSRRDTHMPQIKTKNGSAAWARSIHTIGHKTFHREDSVSAWSQDETLHEDYRSDWDVTGEDGSLDSAGTISHFDL